MRIDDLVEEEEAGLPEPRKRGVKRNIYQDPINRYDYCAIFARITRSNIGRVLKATEGWPLDWFFEIYSYLKTYRPHEAEKKAKYVNWMLKHGRLKEIK